MQTVSVTAGNRADAVNRLTEACPSFRRDWRRDRFYFDEDGEPIGHIVVGELCSHLVDRLEHGDSSELRSVLAQAELMAEGEDQYAIDLALTGVVEDLYNRVSWRIYEGHEVRPEWVRDLLGPGCRAYWDHWDSFTNGLPGDSGGAR